MASDCIQTIIRALWEWADCIPEPVIDFIERHKTSMTDSGDEMELDLNSLSKEQLWELLRLVKSYSEGRDQGFASESVKTQTDAAELERKSKQKKLPKKMRGSLSGKNWKDVGQSQRCVSGFREDGRSDGN